MNCKESSNILRSIRDGTEVRIVNLQENMTNLKGMTYEKSVQLPTFDGSEDKFQSFWMRIKAYTKVYKFAPVLKIGGEADLPATYATW
jgi:hypothetical protein